MSCDLSKGRLELCKDAIGGIKKVWFANFGATFVLDVDDQVTDINDGAAIPGAITLYEYETKDASNLEETINSSRQNGTTFWAQVLNLVIKKMDKVTRKELKIMAYGQPHVIVQDNNDNLLVVGMLRGADVTGGTFATGTQVGDLNGYTITLTGQEKTPANFVTPGTTASDASYPFDTLTTPPTIVKGTDPPA